MQQFQDSLEIQCDGKGLYEITTQVGEWVRDCNIETGLLNLFVQHTSCSLLIQENADPEVRHDLDRFFSRLIKDGDPLFRHRSEGPDDMSAHIRSALTATSLTIPVQKGAPALGVWQGIFLYEHRVRPLSRHVLLHLTGE